MNVEGFMGAKLSLEVVDKVSATLDRSIHGAPACRASGRCED